MSKKHKLSPSEKVNYIRKGKIKGRKFKIFQQALLLLVILGVIVLISFSYLKNYQKRQGLEKEIMQAKTKIQEYEQGNKELKELLNYLDSDQAIEEKARINLGLQKEGEKVVVIKRNFSDKNENEFSVNEHKPESSNLKKWLNYFFNINDK